MIKKRCTFCKRSKSLNCYFKYITGPRKGKIWSQCKLCRKKQLYQWRKLKPEKYEKNYRAGRLKMVYGITIEQWDELFERQKGCCAICGRHQSQFKKRLAVEHNHQTKEIQGLCCTFCNSYFLGRHRDPVLFEKAADYLRNSHTGWYVPDKKRKKRKKNT